jgi:hypothetical protein
LNGLHWFQQKFGHKPDAIPVLPEQTQQTPFRLLISFGQPKAGARLLQLAQQLHILGETHALHFTPNADISISEAEIFEKEGFEPIVGLADKYHLPLQTHYKASNNVPQEIIQHANRGAYNLMLIGSSRPLFSSDETGGMVQTFFESIDCSIGVLIDKGFGQIKKVLMVYYDEQDTHLLKLLHQCFERENMPQFKVLSYEEPTEVVAPYVAKGNWVVQANLEMSSFREYDLLILSRNFWEVIKLQRYELMAYAPSILILHPGNEPK